MVMQLSVEHFKSIGKPECDADWVRANESIEHRIEKSEKAIELTMKANWPRSAAEQFVLLDLRRGPLARALKDRDQCYAASTYTLVNLLIDHYLARHGSFLESQ